MSAKENRHLILGFPAVDCVVVGAVEGVVGGTVVARK